MIESQLLDLRNLVETQMEELESQRELLKAQQLKMDSPGGKTSRTSRKYRRRQTLNVYCDRRRRDAWDRAPAAIRRRLPMRRSRSKLRIASGNWGPLRSAAISVCAMNPFLAGPLTSHK